jgi:hypothetical protein
MKKLVVICTLIFVSLIFFKTSSCAFSLNVSPPSFRAVVEPGGSTSGIITVMNTSDNDIGINVYAEDWLYKPDGSKSFHAAGTTPLSCAKWIRLFPKKFQIEPHGKMAVQYTISVPEDVKGGYYAVIFSESVPLGKEGQEGEMTVRFAGRLGTVVYLETEGRSTRKASVESLSITPPQSNKPLEMALSYKNNGNVWIGAEGTLNIMDGEGNIFGKERFGPVNTLPGDTAEAKVEWLGDLEEGTYYAVVTLDVGAAEPIVEEREIIISHGGTVKRFSVDISDGKPSFSVIAKNTGHLNINASGKIEVLAEDGEVVKSLDLGKSLIAPGKEKELNSSLSERLSNGTYTARAVISIGGREFTKEEVFFIK